MSDVPSPQAYYTGPSSGRPSTGLMPKFQVLVAGCMFATIFLPWISWGFSYSQYNSSFGINYSLWDIVSHTNERSTGWMLIFAIGVAVALFGSIFELVKGSPGQIARWIALGGFVTSVGGGILGLVTGPGDLGLGSSYGSSVGLTTSLAYGFWLGLSIAAVGSLLSLAYLPTPSTPARMPATLVITPWGPPPGMSLGEYDSVPGHAAPGIGGPASPVPGFEVPIHVPPSYGPPIYPMPGHMTSAYPMPGQLPGHLPGHSAAPDWATPTSEPQADPASATGNEAAPTGTPTPGHLVLLEAGRSTTLVVQPGERLLVGRDPDAQIRVSDPRVSARHATIERRGDGWVVQDVDAINPTRLIDAWGTSRTVRGETTVPSGQILVGDVTVTLYPNPV